MKSLRLAFVCCRPRAEGYESGPSFIYRCQNLAMALSSLGHEVELAHYSRFNPGQPFDVVVFHRPRYSFTFRLMLRRLRRLGTLCIADFDDMVFDPSWANSSPGVVNGQVSLRQTQTNFSRHAKALKLFNAASVSTTPLMDDMHQSHGLMPWLIPNAVHLSWRTHESSANTKSATPLITYFPGTRSHDRDFTLLRKPLIEWLNQHPEVRFQVTGELADEQVLDGISTDQLIRNPKQPFAEYRAHVEQSWINLAPLEGTPFNQRKSALKAIEASYYNTVTLASPIPDMQRLADAGAHLVDVSKNVPVVDSVDASDDAWFTALTAAYTDVQEPQDLRSHILKHADAYEIARSFLVLVSEHKSGANPS